MNNSNNLLYLISIDSFFNGLLFLLIFNIKLSKKDKIEYYNTMIISSKERYIYFFIVWLISITASLLLYVPINISILILPILFFFIRGTQYFKKIIHFVDRHIYNYSEILLSKTIYHIIQFLSKTVLCESSNIRPEEIGEVYKKMGYTKLLEFIQSFIMACVYEYIIVYYGALGYLFNYGTQFSDNYDKKQYILGLLNSKNWEKLFSSKTIGLFFDIYRTSNNKQISKYIQYQLTRFHFKLLIYFSIWSLVGFIGNNILIPILFYYIYMEEWREHRFVFVTLSLISVLPIFPDYVSIFLFIITPNFYKYVAKKFADLPKDYNSIFWINLVWSSSFFTIYSKLAIFILTIILVKRNIYWLVYFYLLGLLSNYNAIHMVILLIFGLSFSLIKTYKEQKII